MATLDSAGNATVNGNLTVKYHSSRGVKTEELGILAAAHRSAVKALNQTNAVLAGTKSSSVLGAALFSHFRISGTGVSAARTLVTNVFTAIHAGLTANPLNISDVNERSGDGVLGYVTTVNGAAQGSIHIEFNLLKAALRNVVSMTLIHEASHRFANTQDHAYAYQSGYPSLTRAQAIDNADSYAFFAWSISLGTVVTANHALAEAFKRLRLGIL